MWQKAKGFFQRSKGWIQGVGLVVCGVIGSVLATTQPAMAEGEAFLVTSLQLAPLTTTITGNLAVLLPVGLTIMAILIGVSLIPRILYKFF